MDNLAQKYDSINAAKRHLTFQHDPTSTQGWITLAKKDPQTHKFRQFHYKPDELAEQLSQWTDEDVYYSQNTFYKPQRRIDSIRQLRSLYVDLDVYNLGLKPEWVLGKLELEFFGKTIPDPNVVIFSGRGLVLIWNIEPLPYMAMPLWRAVENFFVQSLMAVGADAKASDPARIFRLPGTVNSKNHATVTAEYRHDFRYDIHDLQYEYLPELTPPSPRTKPKKGRKPKVLHLFNVFTLHQARAIDIARLVEIRNGDVGRCRELICFLYRYFTCCFTSDPDRALEETLDLNSEFVRPLSEKEVRSATKTAEKAWAAKSDAKANEAAKEMGFPGAGYCLKNSKIIDWLGITPEEEQQLQTIISPTEKRRRNTLAKREARRKAGVKPREEYEAARTEKKLSRLEQLKQALEESPAMNNVKLAAKLGISEAYIRKLKKQLHSQS